MLRRCWRTHNESVADSNEIRNPKSVQGNDLRPPIDAADLVRWLGNSGWGLEEGKRNLHMERSAAARHPDRLLVTQGLAWDRCPEPSVPLFQLPRPVLRHMPWEAYALGGILDPMNALAALAEP